MKKKLRSDSSFAKLSHDDLALVDDMLMHHASYEDVQSFMLSRDIKVSQTSISEYYQLHLRPRLDARRERLAASINETADGSELDDATKMSVKQRLFEMMLDPQVDSLSVQRLYNILIRLELLEQNERKLALLEKKAADADAAKEQLTRTAQSASLSPEALAQIEEAIKLL